MSLQEAKAALSRGLGREATTADLLLALVTLVQRDLQKVVAAERKHASRRRRSAP